MGLLSQILMGLLACTPSLCPCRFPEQGFHYISHVSFRGSSGYDHEKTPKYQDLKAAPFPGGALFSQPCSCHVPGLHPACSGEAALRPAGTAAARALPPGHGRPPPPSGRPSVLSAPAPAASDAPLPAASPLRPLPEAPGSLPGPGESEGGSTEVIKLGSTCPFIHPVNQKYLLSTSYLLGMVPGALCPLRCPVRIKEIYHSGL